MFRKQKGITLIALVITIIVLLILAGVSINLVVGEGGILGKAQNGVSASRAGSVKEEIGLAWSACETEYMEEWVSNQGIDKSTFFTKEKLNENLGNKGIVKAVTYNETGDSTLTYASVDGNLVYAMKISSTGQVSIEGEPTVSDIPATPGASTYTAYSVGAEVALKSDSNEQFYVIEASDENTEMVTLLAKYVLDASATKQTNADIDCVFSTSNYWKNETLPSSSPYFNLNDYPAVKNDTGSAVYKANKYATEELGAESGRLLTYEEANALKDSIPDIIWVTYGNSKYYWLGSANGTRDVWRVFGDGRCFGSDDYGDCDFCGVRPVIEISKSLIQ